nr:hypothetical protein GCM10020241_60240 [Streptoalloteichus tenebrarius]
MRCETSIARSTLPTGGTVPSGHGARPTAGGRSSRDPSTAARRRLAATAESAPPVTTGQTLPRTARANHSAICLANPTSWDQESKSLARVGSTATSPPTHSLTRGT